MMMHLARGGAALAILCALVMPVQAAQLTNAVVLGTGAADNWTDLGAGPLTVALRGSNPGVQIAISDTQPAATFAGETLLGSRHYEGASHVWALAYLGAASLVTVTNESLIAGGSAASPSFVSPAGGIPSDAAVTQQSLAGLVAIGTRTAEPASLGEWGVQNQGAQTQYLVGYAADGTTRLWTLAIGPGAGQGKQGGDESYLQNVGPFKGPMTLWGTSGDQAMLTRQ